MCDVGIEKFDLYVREGKIILWEIKLKFFIYFDLFLCFSSDVWISEF